MPGAGSRVENKDLIFNGNTVSIGKVNNSEMDTGESCTTM